MRVLVVDDQRYWRQSLEECLAEHGYQVTCVESAAGALEALERDPEIALLVTDWVMPGVSGVELCRRVRDLPRRRYLPIVLMTARGDAALVEALDAGADAFLAKPFEPIELLAQLRVAERTLALEARLESQIHDLRMARERIDTDLAQAAEVQRTFMPAEPPLLPGAEFAWYCEPCAQLGGDLFNVVRMSERHVGVHVLDVSGHGTSAALYSVSLSHVLHPVAQQGGILKRVTPNTRDWHIVPPSEVAAELNRRFPLIERSGHYVTFLYGVLELDTLRFRYVRAGHPGPIWVTGGQAHVCEEGGSIPIGVDADAEFQDIEIQLQRGDDLVLVTDGVLETRNPQGGVYDLERTLAVVQQSARLGAGDTIEALRTGLNDFRKDEPQRDDVTMVALRIEPEDA